MKKNTRVAFKQYLSRTAELNDLEVIDLSTNFEVEPSIEQKLEEVIQHSSAFLQLINVEPVDDQEGEVLGLDIGEPIAGTTDTDEHDRQPTDINGLKGKRKYRCEQTNFDSSIKYKHLDRWAKLKDFQLKIRNAITKRQALDRIIIGFNGVERAENSNRKVNKLLQDVNKGWLQKMREDKPEAVMSTITLNNGSTINAVYVGHGQPYKNLDALVQDGVDNLIGEVFRDDTDLVAICGRKLLSDKYFEAVNKEQENSELLAAGIIMSKKQIGGLPAVRVPYFPENAVLITPLSNLSIYYQTETRRRRIIDNPKRDRVENYESVNECYVIEEYDAAALIENIVLEDKEVLALEASLITEPKKDDDQ